MPRPTPDSGIDMDVAEKMRGAFPTEASDDKPKRPRRYKRMKRAMKRGLVSEEAFERASKKHG